MFDRKKHYEKNREKIRKQSKEWYERNREEKLERNRIYGKKRYRERKKFFDDYKLSKGCLTCGYNKCAKALVFHHPKDDKDFNISQRFNNNFERLKAEMEKCEVLCCRCHRELHAEKAEGDINANS